MEVFTQLVSNIKGFACKSVYSPCVNWIWDCGVSFSFFRFKFLLSYALQWLPFRIFEQKPNKWHNPSHRWLQQILRLCFWPIRACWTWLWLDDLTWRRENFPWRLSWRSLAKVQRRRNWSPLLQVHFAYIAWHCQHQKMKKKPFTGNFVPKVLQTPNKKLSRMTVFNESNKSLFQSEFHRTNACEEVSNSFQKFQNLQLGKYCAKI